jgi:hypothetical protein
MYCRACALVVTLLTAHSFCADVPTEDPPPIRRPELAGRIVKVFDFEERTSNPGLVPKDWHLGQSDPDANFTRHGFPPWNRATLDYTAEEGKAFQGEGSLMLHASGGSASLVLDAGVIPIFESSPYEVSSRVMTRGMRHARAFVATRLLDERGEPIPTTLRRSNPILSEDTWVAVSAPVATGVAGAAFLQIELLLMQPEQAAPSASTPFHVWEQDIGVKAWFDDVTVIQPPRITLRTNDATNVVHAPDQLTISMTVRDLTGDDLTASILVRDAQGRVVDSSQQNLVPGGATTEWKPRLERYGWYKVGVDVRSGESIVGHREAAFAWLPPSPPVLPRRAAPIRPMEELDSHHCWAYVRDVPVEAAGMLHLARTLGVGGAVLPLWTGGTPGSDHTPLNTKIIDVLLHNDLDAAFSVPRALPIDSASPTPLDAWGMMSGDASRWSSTLTPYMDRYGQRVRRWHIGSPDSESWTPLRPDFPAQAHRISTALATLVPGPIVGVPSAWDILPTPSQSDSQAIAYICTAPPGISAASVGAAVDGWRGLAPDPSKAVTFVLGGDQPAELVKQMVEFWGAAYQPDGAAPSFHLALTDLWRANAHTPSGVEPSPTFAAARTALTALRGRRVVGEYPLAPGVRCFILSPATPQQATRGGALVVWNENAPPSEAHITTFLGDGPIRVIDIDGNERQHTLSSHTPGAATRIEAGPEPIFVEGIDLEFVRFLVGFQVEPILLEASNTQHSLDLLIRNPWRVGVSGTISVLEPGGYHSSRRDRSWRVSPRTFPFTIGPGEERRVPFSVAYGTSQEVGSRDFVFQVELAGERSYAPVEVRRRFEIGRRDLTLELTASIAENNTDVIVQALIGNAGEKTMSLDLTLFPPEHARQKGAIANLLPGHQSVRRFVLQGKREQMQGQTMMLTVRDSASGAQITRSVRVP